MREIRYLKDVQELVKFYQLCGHVCCAANIVFGFLLCNTSSKSPACSAHKYGLMKSVLELRPTLDLNKTIFLCYGNENAYPSILFLYCVNSLDICDLYHSVSPNDIRRPPSCMLHEIERF